MNNVIQIDQATWNAMRSLRSDVAIMCTSNKNGMYDEGIKREKEIYQYMMGQCLRPTVH